jgi:hypothetical protein
MKTVKHPSGALQHLQSVALDTLLSQDAFIGPIALIRNA